MNSNFYKIFRSYQEISVRYDESRKAVWVYFNPTPKPCFSTIMLQNIRQVQLDIIDFFRTEMDHENAPIRYFILGSQVPGVFNFGGDLALFVELIKSQDRRRLINYATLCIDAIYTNAISMNLPLTTISVVEGSALGGGFETALSSNVLLATPQSEMGFPENRFNCFPGMGAYSLLARLAGMAVADKMISSGKIYTGAALYRMGFIKQLLDPDNIQGSVENYIRKHQRSGLGSRGMQLVRQRYHPLDYQELIDISTIWVDTSLQLLDKDLRMMERLAKAQTVKLTEKPNTKKQLIRTKQDRRVSPPDVSFPLTDWSNKIIYIDRRFNFDRRT